MLSGATTPRFGFWSSERTARSRPLNHFAPAAAPDRRPTGTSSSRSAAARRAISTRYAMLAAEPREHLPRRLGAARLHVRQTMLNPFDRLDAVEERLVGLGILHDQLGLAVDGQDKRVSGLPEPIQQVDGIALELTERTNVVGKNRASRPHQICIEFDDHT